MSNEISRRNFIKKMVVAGAAVSTANFIPPLVKNSYAARDYILIGRPNPSTGPLASFGEATPWVEKKALAAINKEGGIFIKELGKKLPIKIKVVDTQSDPTKAGDAASKLILKDKVDLMVVMHTPDTVNPVAAMCERYEVPCISLDAPVDAWLSGGPYEWCHHAFWTTDAIADLYIGMWDKYADQHNKTVGVLWPNDPDGKTFRPIFAEKAAAKGYKIVDTGHFPYNMKDYSSIIGTFKKKGAQIVCGAMIPPDFITFRRQSFREGFHPKMVTMAKAILFPSDVAALGGNLPEGLLTENWWSPNHPFRSSLDGTTTKSLCDAWTKETGKPWVAPLGFKYAGLEIAADVFKRAQSLDKKVLLDAIGKTNLNTFVGPIKYNDKHYSQTPLVGGQWKKGKKAPWELGIVYNEKHPEIPLNAELEYPLPG